MAVIEGVAGGADFISRISATGFTRKAEVSMLRNVGQAPVIVLDEATASLSLAPENETRVQAPVDWLIKGKTVMAIAHRLRSVGNSDKSWRWTGGQVRETGTYHGLMARDKGLYRHLYTLQVQSAGWAVGQEGQEP
nr:hypothetical protein [Desulfobacter curvatus]